MITHKSPISAVATFNNKYIATAGYDNIIVLWNAETGESIARGCHDHLVNQCTFSHDGKYLASSSSDYSARIWSVPDMKLLSIINHHIDDAEGLSFHSSKPIIATSSQDPTICISDLNGNLIIKLIGHDAQVVSVEWINGTDTLVSSSDDGTVKYWDTITGKVIKTLSFDDVQTDTIALTNEGLVFAGNDNGEIILIKDGTLVSKIPAHKSGIKKLVYSNILKKLISLSYDRTFKVWRYENDTVQLESSQSYGSMIWARSCAFLNNNEIIFGTFGDKYARFNLSINKWFTDDVKHTNGINAVIKNHNTTYWIGDAGILYVNGKPNGNLGSLCNFLIEYENNIITGGQSGEVFNALTGETLYQHNSPLNCAAIFESKDEKLLIIGAYTGEGIIFEMGKNKPQLKTIIKLHPNAIKGVSASKNLIFSVCATGAVSFNNTEDFKCVKYDNNAHSKIANGCAIIGNNSFASISRDLKLRIWNNYHAEEISTDHKNSIKCIASSKDGKYLALGDYRGCCSVYDTLNREFVKYFKLSDFGISSITYDVIQDKFLASSYNGRILEINLN